MKSFEDVLIKRTLNCFQRLEFFSIYKTIDDDANFRVKGPFGTRLRLTLQKILQRIDTLACPPLPFPLMLQHVTNQNHQGPKNFKCCEDFYANTFSTREALQQTSTKFVQKSNSVQIC